MVDSCSRENGALCTVARSWLLFLHDKSERKNCDSNIAWGVKWIAPNILKLWKLCRLVWHRVWLICNVKRCFYWTTIFLRKMAEFYLWWFGVTLGSGLSVSEVWTAASVLEDRFCVIIGCWEKLFGCFEGNYENTGRMEMFPMPGESDLVR